MNQHGEPGSHRTELGSRNGSQETEPAGRVTRRTRQGAAGTRSTGRVDGANTWDKDSRHLASCLYGRVWGRGGY